MKKELILIGEKSKKAFTNKISSKKKDEVLNHFSFLIRQNKNLIILENKKDIKNAYKKNLKNNLIQRLTLDDKKISYIIKSIRKIRALKDPINVILEKWKRPNGLKISKI